MLECFFIVQAKTTHQIDLVSMTLGFLGGGRVSVSYIYGLELLPKQGREQFAAGQIFFTSMSFIVTSLLFYYVKDFVAYFEI